MSGGGQRIDIWLWRARLFKTRAQAAAAIQAGQVRLVRGTQSRVIDKPSAHVAPGDGLAVVAERRLRTLTIQSLPERRGPAREAALSYEEDNGRPLDEDIGALHVSGAEKGTDAP
jgi:ribosome-associated heat shock protein Hsp15